MRPRTLVLTLFVMACIAPPISAAEISEITVTPDGKRVAIKSESRMGKHTEQVVGNPSRLIIDVNGTGVSKLPPISGVTNRSAMDIRTAKTASGARVVLDFGRQSVPDYKVLRMDNYLLVFLGQGTASGGQDPPSKPERVQTRPKEPQSIPVAVMPRKKLSVDSATEGSGGSDLFIQSAEVKDGLIILKVCGKTDPFTVYRIDLGVDFKQLGFSTARVSPVRETAGPSRTAVAPDSLVTGRPGPRKLQRNLMAVSNMAAHEDSEAHKR
jgi:hypothetical protein